MTASTVFFVLAPLMTLLLARLTSWRVGAVLAAWLALTGALAATGALTPVANKPPPMVFLIAVLLIAQIVWMTRPSTRAWLDKMSPWVLVVLQAFRIPVELALWGMCREGLVPAHMTFEGGNLDIVSGVLGLVVGVAMWRGWVGRRVERVFHVVGLALLATIVFRAVTSLPGPQHLGWPGVSPIALTELPGVWLPTFLAPLALTLHNLSFIKMSRTKQ
jgi:hypothetical protein